MQRQYPTHLFPIAAWLLVMTAGCAAIWALWLSRYQPIEWDLAMMHYVAFLLNEKGFILYRDIFENNLPGAFLFHVILGKLIGYEALPLRMVDFTILASISFVTWKITSPVSRPAAILAPSLFVGVYLYTGSSVELQRDYLGILPIAIAVFTVSLEKQDPAIRALLLGALCAVSCGFKPNYIITFPALYLLLCRENRQCTIQTRIRHLILMGFTFIAVFSVPFIWGIFKADYNALVYIYKTFTPIYVQSRTDLYHYSNSSDQLLELLKNQLVHMRNALMISAPGLLWSWRQYAPSSRQRKIIFNIAFMTFVFSWYELMAGKFWLAHLLPSYYWIALSFSLLLTTPGQHRSSVNSWVYIVSLIFCAGVSYLLLSGTIAKVSSAGYTASNSHIRSQKIAHYLKQHLRHGETVQGIDGSGDGQASLLIARATVATRYLEDIPLYMQPDAPATQSFRREFLDGLQKTQPAYIVYVHNIFHPAGGNRLKEFSELDRFIEENYAVVLLEDGEFTIYQRKSPSTTSQPDVK